TGQRGKLDRHLLDLFQIRADERFGMRHHAVSAFSSTTFCTANLRGIRTRTVPSSHRISAVCVLSSLSKLLSSIRFGASRHNSFTSPALRLSTGAGSSSGASSHFVNS